MVSASDNGAVPGSSPAVTTYWILGRPEFKSSAPLVNSQLVVFCQLGFLSLCYVVFELFVSKYLTRVPVN